MFPLKLDRPLIFFDIESTGIVPRADRIIELGAIRFNEDGSREERCWLFNPTIPIPIETTAIHGITDEDVKDQPTFKDCAFEVLAFFGEADLGGFNHGHFDIPILTEEFARCEIKFDTTFRRIIDVQKIFHRHEPRDLPAAAKFYCDKDYEPARGAEYKRDLVLEILNGEFSRYQDIPQSVTSLDKALIQRDPFNADFAGFFRWVDGVLTINFGKNKGIAVSKLATEDQGFLQWIAKNDFPLDTRKIARNALEGIYPPAIVAVQQ